METQDCNQWHRDIAIQSKHSKEFVAGAMCTAATAESMAEQSDCNAIDMLMEAINFLLKQENQGVPLSPDEALEALEPLISLLEEGVMSDVH